MVETESMLSVPFADAVCQSIGNCVPFMRLIVKVSITGGLKSTSAALEYREDRAPEHEKT